jgi:flagellar protein FliS
MSYSDPRTAISEYVQAGTQIADIEPYKAVQMLLEGAMDRIASAKGYMQHGDIALKGEHFGKAANIIEGLRAGLDRQSGGDVAENLESLYGYMQRRLLEANLHNNAALADEVLGLLGEIKQAWDAISDSARNTAAR